MKKIVNTMSWEEVYEYAKKYYEAYNDLEVPNRFRTNDGVTKDDNGVVGLGAWIAYQRKTVCEDSEKGELLKKIGMRFNNKKVVIPFDEYYKVLKNNYDHYGCIAVESNFITDDGINYNENGKYKLGEWLKNAKRAYSEDSEKGQKLVALGYSFKKKNIFHDFRDFYAIAKAYYLSHGNLNVKSGFRTNDGENYDPEGEYDLYYWINAQRELLLAEPEKIKLLAKIGFPFEKERHFHSFEEYFKYAVRFYKKHGNLDVPAKFKTNNGYDFDKEGTVSLGRWVIAVRKYFKMKSPEDFTNVDIMRKEALDKIGMRWENIINTMSWEENYEYAKKYFETIGNLRVDEKFKTNNGYEYNVNGKVNLGNWINRNKKNKGADPKRDMALFKIGMIYKVLDNDKRVLKICEIYGINYNVNFRLLKNMSYQELLAKIYYSHYNNIKLANTSGVLNEIFYLTSNELKEKYNITATEIIDIYYIERNDLDKTSIEPSLLRRRFQA